MPKPPTKRRSSTMFVTQPAMRKRNGLLLSPMALNTPAPIL